MQNPNVATDKTYETVLKKLQNQKCPGVNMILASPKNAPKDIQLYEHGLRYNIKPKLIIVYLFPFFFAADVSVDTAVCC